MFKKAILTIVLLLTFTSSVFAGLVFSSAFYARAGYANEWDYWAAQAGTNIGSINDLITIALGKLGYTGTVNDRLWQYTADLTGNYSNSLKDNILILEVTGISAGVTTAFLLQNDDYLLLEDTDYLLLEG